MSGFAREHQHRSTDTPPRLDFSGSDVGATHEMGATHDEVCHEMTNTVDKRELSCFSIPQAGDKKENIYFDCGVERNDMTSHDVVTSCDQ